MKRSGLTTLFTAATLSLSVGCASTGSLPAWTRTSTWFHRESAPAAATDESSVASSSKRSTDAGGEELSPEFREAQKMFKKNTEKTLLAWARYQEDIGEYAEARKLYHELQLAYPKNIEAHLGMARIESLTGRSQQAERLLTELKKDYPENSAAMVELGRLYSQQEEWDKAIREFEDACDVEPEDQNCRYELGVGLARAGKLDEALSHLTFAVGAPAANYNIGYVLSEQGKTADAAEWMQNALALHPDQRTAERAKAMLAKLLPPDARSNEAVAGTHRETSPEAEPIVSSGASATRRQSTTRRIASQFTPAPAGTGRGDQLPFVSTEQISEGIPLPVAESESGVPGGFAPASPTEKSPFHTVSHAATDNSGKAFLLTGHPPQWNGPSAHATGQPGSTPVGTQDPPNWRDEELVPVHCSEAGH